MTGSQVFLLITTILVSLYVLLIYRYVTWFQKLKVFRPKKVIPKTRFSVIIPARDEQNEIGRCLDSILNSGYPRDLYEIIVVDDHSTDNTSQIVESFSLKYDNVKLVRLNQVLKHKPLNSYKKKAIETAIGYAKYDWIITTDADCHVPTSWLVYYDAYIQKNDLYFVGAPVLFNSHETIVSTFQELDFLSLQGITAASVSAGFHSMCNGANIAYKKSVFLEVGGFRDIDSIASGDDMLLMQKIKRKYEHKIGYMFCRGAVVYTEPMRTWGEFLNQRIRWASKSTHYKDKSILLVLILVYLVNLLLVAFPFIYMSFDNELGEMFEYWILFIVIKSGIEFIFLFNVASMFKRKYLLKWFFIMQPLHIVYTVMAGFLGKAGAYTWKGRKVR